MSYHRDERIVVAYTAGTAAEAMVIRGLLESAGIDSPGSVSTDPFPLNEPSEGAHGAEVWVRESQVEQAKRLIAEYAQSDGGSTPTGE